LGTLEDDGCSYIVQNGALKVTTAAMMMMKGLRQESLYVLHGTIVTDSAAVCTTSTDVDTTKLWHK